MYDPVNLMLHCLRMYSMPVHMAGGAFGDYEQLVVLLKKTLPTGTEV